MAWYDWILAIAYGACALLLLGFAVHRVVLMELYWRHRHAAPLPPGRFEDRPTITVQLPIYNERHVARRLLRAVAAFDYPQDRLQIQILDDSTDETQAICAEEAARMRAAGLDVEIVRRSTRQGFKAGALKHGLASARGEFVCIFDADFVPAPDFLQQTIDHFADPEVGMVQARWGHLNARHSWLTRVESVLLDGHFLLEHAARNRSGRFFNFNGTAGVWRKACIESAGGWEADTLTEDLDLSYRAQLRGWRFVYLQDVVAPGELPANLQAFRTQQYRWAKGSLQTARKLLKRIWSVGHVSFRTRMEATAHLTANCGYLAFGGLCVLGWPLTRISPAAADWVGALGLTTFVAAVGSALAFYALAIWEGRKQPLKSLSPASTTRSSLLDLALVVPVSIGMSINNGRAVVDALRGRRTPFVRTPKSGMMDGSASSSAHPMRPLFESRPEWGVRLTETALTLVCSVIALKFLAAGVWTGAVFACTLAAGFGLMTVWSLLHRTGPEPVPIMKHAALTAATTADPSDSQKSQSIPPRPLQHQHPR